MPNSNFNKFTIQKSFAISAGAGSGKTYTLSRRYINAVLGFDFFRENETQEQFVEDKEKNRVKDISQIVTMTYTEAAALEMKERIFDLMAKIIEFDPQNSDTDDFESIEMGMKKLSDTQKQYVKESLQNALQNSNNAFISTIHSFCLDTIASNSDIARLDSKLSIIQDDEKQKILDVVRLEVMTAYEKVFDIFKNNNKFKVNQIIEKYATNSKFRDSFDAFVDNTPLTINIYKDMIKELFPLPEVTLELSDEVSENDITQEWFYEYLQKFEDFNAVVWKDVKKEKAPILKKDTLLKEFAITNKANSLVKIYSQAIDIDKENNFNLQIKELQKLLTKIHDKYIAKLKKENKIDFDTIIATTASIVDKVKNNYKYIMVDEFQDTNALQNDIVNIISENKNLFVVGDSKQSIYSFQGAELEVFNGAISKLHQVPMNVNYRSDKKILTFVNDVFSTLFEQENNPDRLISSNYKAIFTEEDKLLPSSDKRDGGKVEFLISQEDAYQQANNQMKDIAKFIKAIKNDSIDGYDEIKKKIKEKKKAIGILFDSKTKMLELKKELDLLGIEAKVSATENFYHTREINDIFLVLKSIMILKSYKKEEEKSKKLSSGDKFYIAGALRSNILRYDEKEIIGLLQGDLETIIDIFGDFIEQSKLLPISSLIKYIVDSSKLLDIYTYLGSIEQRYANIEKLIELSIRFETDNSNDMYSYLEDLQRSIYFTKDSKEDEAFYKSDNLESIELCTIHSTKGLAYPMVILAQSEKGLHANASGEMGLSFASFTLNQNSKSTDYSAVGFKMDEYEPLIYRILKQISKNKHEAEKKRLLYVALTRAEHNLVIAGSVYKTKDKVGLGDYSYLSWLSIKAYGVDKETLFDNTPNDKIRFLDKNIFKDITGEVLSPEKLEKVIYKEKIVEFKTTKKKIASDNKEHDVINENMERQARLGTTIHSILERYWDKLEDENVFDKIYFKYSLFDNESKEKIRKYLENFKTTNTYKQLLSGVEHHFEIELNTYEKTKHSQGIIDLVYFDKEKNGWVIVDFKSNSVDGKKDLTKFAQDEGYDKQLDNYEMLYESKGMKVVGKILLFLDNGREIEINEPFYKG